MQSMIKNAALLAVIVVVFFLLLPDTREVGPRDYPGPWSQELDVTIARALASVDARECGEYRWKVHQDREFDRLVQCVDGDTVIATYRVLSASSIEGPMADGERFN
jgi:hypothetical protein